MAYVRQIEPDSVEAASDPILSAIYRDAVRRAGRVWNVVKIGSLAPQATRANLGLYQAAMLAPGALPRRLRETLAVVVSRSNGCGY